MTLALAAGLVLLGAAVGGLAVYLALIWAFLDHWRL